MDRRKFLASGLSALGAGLLLPSVRALGLESTSEANGAAKAFPDLVLARGEAKQATRSALAAIGGMERFVAPGQVVVIKPNASFSSPPEWGATTDPEVLAAVIEACLDAEARRVLVVDHTMRDAQRCFERSGTADAVAAFPKTKLIALDDEKTYREIAVPAGKALDAIKIPVVMQKADVFINLPTAKSHTATGVSFGFKNLMGLIWDRRRFHQDLDLHRGIADLGTVLRPQLTVLDAMRILKTGGPTGPGDVESFGGVIAGVDPVAVDAYGVGLSTWNGQTYAADQIPFIRHAAELGLGVMNLESLEIEERT
jgi:uncharacterized protein (DUF362 family)